ncbi:alpha/beta hydrolase family protein [Rhodococcus sp. NPDC058521]|uniref:alpha/beta hydrolase family protein n=1 Tax=Rhodococcus sp. NPDC058521 TaxID=3346536 RepID=UPI00365D8480
MLRNLLVVLCAAGLSIGGVGTATAQPAPVVPDPGSAIGVTDVTLVDHDRPDPWAAGTTREIPVTITYPASEVAGHEQSTYIPRAVADSIGAPGLADLRTNGHVNAPVASNGDRSLPVVLFSPGFNVPRFLNTVHAEALAARGYVVISIDHTGDALATGFPDGRVVPTRIPDEYSDAGLRGAIDARVADARFVMGVVDDLSADGTSDAVSGQLPDGLASGLDSDKVGMFGHSMGGASAAEVLRVDPRLDAAVNLDGALFYGSDPSPAVTEGVDGPLLSVISSLHADSQDGRERFWNQYFATPRGWSKVYAVANTGHGSFTDGEHFLPQNVPDLPFFEIPGGLSFGTAPRGEVLGTTNGLLADMFDRFLKGAQVPSLENPATQYPLVHEVR